ncbi:MAG TPA: glycosyltransferase family 2 protein [Pyrinomonadaceae bacterium]|jgi:cellulose synthase/poly-beta-1,6-N-acetylglucosamine synthase-like glycosyltransferase|nr:glycosyltransferase family 2 protein [Pyrinomonadaceae bacterium]
MMFFQDTVPPFGPTPNQLFQQYFHDGINKTWGNISPLYRLDAFDYAVLTLYFVVLGILAVYGAYRVKQVIDFWRYHRLKPTPKALFSETELPRITIQLPLFNEMYVVERLLKAVTEIDYPRERLEIQVLDDSTDETVKLAQATVESYARQGFDIHYVHRTDRTGFKAGALENGLQTAKGELLAIFDADFVPKPDCLLKLVHFFTDPLVGCAQMRWSHINGSYNLLTRLQTIMLDGHFVVEQTVRNRTGGFFNFNGTAGIWRRRAIEMSGGWQHDTLTEDTDLSFRAQLMGWRFVYLLDEDAPSEIPVEINAFKAQQRRWAKGVMQVGIKLYRRIWSAPLPLRVKLEMFFRMTGNISYPLMILVSFLQFPLLLVRYQQGFYHLMLFDVPLLFFSTISVVLFYGTGVWYLDEKRIPRLLHLPLVMAIGIGLAFSNARAVIEALCGMKSEFVRTPKYRVEQASDETWKGKKYKRKRGWLPLLELGFALYFLLAMLYAVRMHMWGTLPFLFLFFFGYGYIGTMSILQAASGRRLQDLWRPLTLKSKAEG